MISKIYSLNQYTMLFSLTNSYSTTANSSLIVETYIQGYLSAKGSFLLPNIQPIYIGATLTSINRFVG
jgi:hypothetical protein